MISTVSLSALSNTEIITFISFTILLLILIFSSSFAFKVKAQNRIFTSKTKSVSYESKQSGDSEKTLEIDKVYSSASIINFKPSNNKVLIAPKAQGWHSPLNIPINCHQKSRLISYDPFRRI